MTLSSSLHVPGAFHADGVHQGIFRPPTSASFSSSSSSSSPSSPSSPSTSEYFPAAAAAAAAAVTRRAPAVVDTTSTPKRKRYHYRSHHLHHLHQEQESQQYQYQAGADTAHTVSEEPRGWPDHDDAPPAAATSLAGVLRPPAHVFTHGQPGVYTLAGELGTPYGGLDDGSVLGESMWSDSNYRRALGCKRPRQDDDMMDPAGPVPLFNLPTEPSQSRAWSSVAFSTIGGVVGRVWEFCKAGAFRGFYAGGGTGYDVQPGDERTSDTPRYHGDDDMVDEHRVPGYFPQGGYGYNEATHDAHAGCDTRASTPTAPAAKRRQTGAADELGRNWVMVKESGPGSKASTPRRPRLHPSQPRNRNHGPSVTTGRRIVAPSPRNTAANAKVPNVASTTPRRYPGRPGSSAAAYPSGQDALRPASSASVASFRSPERTRPAGRAVPNPADAASPSSHTGSPHPGRRSLNQSAGHASFSHRRTHSNASTASSRGGGGGGTPDPIEASPRLDAEAKKLANRRKMEERDADVRIAAFNKRLQDMIRQGKEALGTTIEVDGGDGGWEDDD